MIKNYTHKNLIFRFHKTGKPNHPANPKILLSQQLHHKYNRKHCICTFLHRGQSFHAEIWIHQYKSVHFWAILPCVLSGNNHKLSELDYYRLFRSNHFSDEEIVRPCINRLSNFKFKICS